MTLDTMVLDKVQLIADELWMYNKLIKKTSFGDLSTEDKDLTMFSVINLNLTLGSQVDGVELNIVLKRKATTELMTTFLPTLLLLLLTLSGTFFKVELFGDAMAHNLTIMLVMTTIFTSKIEELPPTSDLKMVDIWLIFCQLVPFTEMVFLTAMDYLREGVKKQQENKKKTGNDGKQNTIPECCWELPRALVPRINKHVRNPNSVEAEQEENISKTEGKGEKKRNEGKGWQKKALEGLEVTGDPLLLNGPHPSQRPTSSPSSSSSSSASTSTLLHPSTTAAMSSGK